MKRTIFGALMTLIVAFTIAVPVVHAQTQTLMTANVPFAFSVGDHQLPAGAYAVREMDRATLIEAKDGKEKVLGIYNNAGPSRTDETKLVFDKVGDHYFLAQIWTRLSGQGLELPKSKLEKEMQASNTPTRGGAETVIVALR